MLSFVIHMLVIRHPHAVICHSHACHSSSTCCLLSADDDGDGFCDEDFDVSGQDHTYSFTWGLNCTNSCAQCVDVCHTIDGYCEECKPGFKGHQIGCSIECGPNEYGANCLGNCEEKCGTDCYDRQTGECQESNDLYYITALSLTLISAVLVLMYLQHEFATTHLSIVLKLLQIIDKLPLANSPCVKLPHISSDYVKLPLINSPCVKLPLINSPCVIFHHRMTKKDKKVRKKKKHVPKSPHVHKHHHRGSKTSRASRASKSPKPPKTKPKSHRRSHGKTARLKKAIFGTNVDDNADEESSQVSLDEELERPRPGFLYRLFFGSPDSKSVISTVAEDDSV
ncbi:hypothetical protein Btru_014731 [Bulinus truncatus]|nr:hypothetical protein Btru_014731 [Bulinus truncatus]